MERIAEVRDRSGAQCLLALKCFASWGLFGPIRAALDGATCSSPFEARLAREHFGGEVQAYGVAFTAAEVRALRGPADTVVFNSLAQLRALRREAQGLRIGLRVRPDVSFSDHDLADPGRPHSRLGVGDREELEAALPHISGVLFHIHCDTQDFKRVDAGLTRIDQQYGDVLRKLDWVNLGGGFAFTRDGFPRAALARRLRDLSRRWGARLYLEPGDAVVAGAGELWATVLDVVRNDIEIAIVDASLAAHLPDHLLYGTRPDLAEERPGGGHRCMIAGRTCLAGDVFGAYMLPRPLKPGDRVRFLDAAGYTMVQNTGFNGWPRPTIAYARENGTIETLRAFGYRDYHDALS